MRCRSPKRIVPIDGRQLARLMVAHDVGVAGATIGAGSTIGKNPPTDALTMTQAPQRTIKGWSRPRKG